MKIAEFSSLQQQARKALSESQFPNFENMGCFFFFALNYNSGYFLTVNYKLGLEVSAVIGKAKSCQLD